MIPKQAIEKAIEGGWEKPTTGSKLWNQYAAALDPTFWQALGKALGWEKQPYLCESCRTIGYRDGNHMNDCLTKMRYGDWDDEAHRFYDLILTNQPTEPFWDNILK